MPQQLNIFETPQQEYIAKSKYARYLDKEQRRETWKETVGRYFTFAAEHLEEKFPQALSKWLEVVDTLAEDVHTLKTMPSMRLLMTAGEAVKRNNIASYNCAYVHIDKVRKFSDLLLILLHGTGIGFSCERQFITKLPVIPENINKTDDVIVVRDSKEGWANAFSILLRYLYQGAVPKVDYSKVRPKGARLKTFGGRASGPEPLKRLFDFVSNLFVYAAGRKLTSLEVHDTCCLIADIVVVGGVRRSALISLSNLSDQRMRDAKEGQWWIANGQRGLANNSAVYTERPEIEIFMAEWLALIKSKSGERGIFNRAAAKKQATRWGRRSADIEYGTNPCCVPGETQVLTDKGYAPIVDLVGNPVSIWNGKEFSTVTPFSVGEHPTVLVEFSDGTELQCTPNHKFVLAGGSRNQTEGARVEACDLKAGDALAKYSMPTIAGGTSYGSDTEAYSQGFYSGDGNTNLNHSWLYAPKYDCESRLKGTFGVEHPSVARKVWKHGPMLSKSFVPVQGDMPYILNWFAGLLDSDGCTVSDLKGNGFQIAAIDKKFLQEVRLMLTRLGVQGKIVRGSDARVQIFKAGQKGYFCKPVWRLLLNCQDAFTLGSLGLKTERLQWSVVQPQRDARRFVKVVAVTPATVCENFCFDEPKNHTGTFNGIVTGQSEILLRSNQMCNLTEAVVHADDTYDSLVQKITAATIMGVYQSSLTDFKGVDQELQRNCEEERLLGVSMTGVMDHPVLNNVNPTAIEWLQKLRDVARAVATEWAGYFGINVSAAITCNKPSGTVAQLTNAGTGGLHPRFGQYYIRTYRQDSKDPLTQFLKEQGIAWEPSASKPETETIFSFVVQSPEGAVMRDHRTAIEQLEHWLMFQRHWCEHKPSITIYVKDHEWLEAGAWVYKHFDEVCGVSFLPYDNGTYRQAPFQEITKLEYTEFLAKYPGTIHWDQFIELDDQTEGAQEMACTGNVCGF